MFTPSYHLTNKLLTYISSAERFYGQIEALRIPKKLELNLERNNLIKSSYASNRIEGNPLTLPEVTNLILDDRIPANRSEKEIINYFEIIKNLDSYGKNIFSLGMIINLHKQLMTGVDKSAGEIRNIQVVVGKYKEDRGDVSLKVKHNPPFHKRTEIEKALNELLFWYNEENNLPVIIRAGIFHHQFVYIHPFEDGNGRVCRILSALIFIQNKYQINKYFVLDDYYDIDRQLYSDKLHSGDYGDITEWLEYFSEGVKYSLQSAWAKYNQAMTTLRAEERLTPREQAVWKIIQEKHEVTSNDIASNLKVSRQQSHQLLKSLLDKGLIDKKGSTKSSYYFLK